MPGATLLGRVGFAVKQYVRTDKRQAARPPTVTLMERIIGGTLTSVEITGLAPGD